MDRSSRPKINKKSVDINNTVDKIDFHNIHNKNQKPVQGADEATW